MIFLKRFIRITSIVPKEIWNKKMKSFYNAIRSVFLVCFLLCCFGGYGYSSPNVPIDDYVYRDIDKLVAAGLIRDAIYAQRPWSRNEIARMIAEARERIAKQQQQSEAIAAAGVILQKLEREYSCELAGAGSTCFKPLEKAALGAAFMDSPFRVVPANNGLSNIKAYVNPLVSYMEGRLVADGSTFTIETAHSAQLSRYFSVYAAPRFDVLDARNGSTNVQARVQALYGKVSLSNIEIEAGRDSLIWGHGEYGGVLASNNAKNPDMVKLSNVSPFVHPSIFKYLGPSKYTFFIANLRSYYVPKDAYVYGLSASFKPASFLEIGFKHQISVGGDGTPDVSFGQKIREFFFIRGDWEPWDETFQESMDNREGFDVRVQIPQLRNAVVYTEGVFEDFGRDSFWPQFTEMMGFTSGIYFPLLTADGSDDLRIEYEHSPAAYGRHFMYASGLSLDDRLRGSELGPDGNGIHVTWRRSFQSGAQLRYEAHYENRGNDMYTQMPSPNGIDRVTKLTNNPKEHRFRLVSSLDWKLGAGLTIRPLFGYERSRNYHFEIGSGRNNFLGAVSLRWFPAIKYGRL
jgi:hypothetical protein